MWTIMTHLHGLMLQGKNDLAMARVCQAMKAIETSVASGGRWDLAWLYTGLKDPRPRFIDRGLAHPAEFATKEVQTVHTALGGAGASGSGSGGGGGGGAGTGPGSGKFGAGSGGYGRGPGHANDAEGNVSGGREKGGGNGRKKDRGKGGKPAGGSTGSPPAGN